MWPWRKHGRRVLLTEVGNRNTGDEALYAAAIRRFSTAGWKVSIVYRVRPRDDVLALAPVELHELRVEDRFDGLHDAESLVRDFAARHPAAWRTTRDLVRQHHLVAVAPGGRFTDGYNNPRALLTAAVALQEGVPLVHLHQSFGPMEAADHRDLLCSVLRHSRLAIVRDDCSLAFLHRQGLTEERLATSRDATFAEVHPAPAPADMDVGINLRHGFNGGARPCVLRAFLLGLHKARPSLRLHVYSTTHAPDEEVRNACEGLASCRGDIPPYSERQVDPGRCRAHFTDSFHGMIFAMFARRPVLCGRTDFATWKIEGTTAPDAAPTEVQPGLVDERHVPELVNRVLAALDAPRPLLERQQALLDHGRILAEAGWQRLWEVL